MWKIFLSVSIKLKGAMLISIIGRILTRMARISKDLLLTKKSYILIIVDLSHYLLQGYKRREPYCFLVLVVASRSLLPYAMQSNAYSTAYTQG